MKTITFAQASHEFRNPLNGILTSLDLLVINGDVDPENIYFISAKNCSLLMLSLINDMLDYA